MGVGRGVCARGLVGSYVVRMSGMGMGVGSMCGGLAWVTMMKVAG